MSRIRDAHYSGICTMLQDMRDYQKHGAWFREAMLPMQPITACHDFQRQAPVTSPQWVPVEYDKHGGDNWYPSPDFHAYQVNKVMIYKVAHLPLNIMRGRNRPALEEWVAPYHATLRGISAYFALERPLDSDYYTLTFFVEPEAYANHLFAEAIGRA